MNEGDYLLTGRLYFNLTDLDDILLAQYLKQPKYEAVLQDSSNYVEAFALTLGISPNQIATPTPYMISRFAELYAYRTVAQRLSSFSKGGDADKDSFALKFTMYKELLKDCEARLTAQTFTNGVSARKRKFPMTIELLRN